MDVKEIVVSRTVRVNTGNYEGTEHLVSMRAELDELDSPERAAGELATLVEEATATQLVRSYAVRGKSDMTRARVARHHGLGAIDKEDGK